MAKQLPSTGEYSDAFISSCLQSAYTREKGFGPPRPRLFFVRGTNLSGSDDSVICKLEKRVRTMLVPAQSARASLWRP